MPKPPAAPASPDPGSGLPASAADDLVVRVCPALSEIPEPAWDRLLDTDDAPLLSWAYLQGLEAAGCVGPGTHWTPAHLTAWRAGALVAAAPAYLKTDSDGEWVMDYDWAAFSEQTLGAPYYPKLSLTVPFNPVTGGRLLTRTDLPPAERAALRRVLLGAAQAVCRTGRLSSAHLLFLRRAELDEAAELGFLPRQQEQYHFVNDGYRDFADFLARMSAHRRSSIRRERRALATAGVTVRTHRGPRSAENPAGFTPEELDRVFEMYVSTSVRYTGEAPYLNRAFFHLCAARPGLRERLELVIARGADGRILGGAWNLRGDRRLLGRYWGEAEHVPFLHFEVCFYHSIERCIAEGLALFEPGHGGEQKLVRGFTPTRVYSAHYLREPRLRRPITAFLQMEAPLAEQSLREATERCPLRPQPTPQPTPTPAPLPSAPGPGKPKAGA